MIPDTYKEYRLPRTTSISDLTLTTVKDVPKTLEKNQVLVKIHAVSLNYRDLLVATGKYAQGLKENLVPCSDGAGEVVSVGGQVTKFKVGDRVAGIFNQGHLIGPDPTAEEFMTGLGGMLDGTLTEYRFFPEDGLVHIPAYMTYEEAATLPCAAVTAWNALYGGPKPLLPGQTVVLQGTGGVSLFGLQIAHAAGAHTIITSSSDEKLTIAKKLGATHVINYRAVPDWDKEVQRLTNGEGADHILEVGGPGTLAKSLQCIRRGGTISVIGFVAQMDDAGLNSASLPSMMIMSGAVLRGVLVGSRQLFQDMNKAFEASKIKPAVDKVFAFEQAKEAFEHLKSQNHVGKVVIKVTQ